MAVCLFAFTGGVYYFSMARLKQDIVMNYQFTDDEKAENQAKASEAKWLKWSWGFFGLGLHDLRLLKLIEKRVHGSAMITADSDIVG